jgi:PEP-CTERM motif
MLAVILLTAAPSPAATVTFSDGTFNLPDYTQTVFTNNTAAAGATDSIAQNLASGNPPPSLDFHVDWTVNTTFTIFDGLINSGFTYNPASGAISALDFSQDRNVTFTSGTVIQSNAAATALLQQGGKFYRDTIVGPAFSAGTWQTISAAGLQASDFSLYDFATNTIDSTQHPDFSSAGSVINFGFRTGLDHTNTLGTGFFDSLSDNLSFTLTTVPEPSSLGLVMTALAAIGLWRWRGRHSGQKSQPDRPNDF